MRNEKSQYKYIREIDIKYRKKRIKNNSPINEHACSPKQIVELFVDLQNEAKEKLITISLDASLKILCFEVVAIGSAYSMSLRPVETIREKFEQNCEKSGLSPEDELQKLLDSEIDQEGFWQRVKDNLSSGKIRLVFVADEIPTELRRIVEFLNEQMNDVEVLALEIKQYIGQEQKTLIPRIYGQSTKTQTRKRKSRE